MAGMAVFDGARIENDVSWNSRLRMTCSRDVSVMGSDVGPGRMFRVDQRSGVMASALGRERAHDGELVVQLSEFFKGRTKGYSGQAGGDFPGHAADFRRGVHLRVKGFELAGSAVHEKKDNRPVLDQLGVLGKEGAGFEQTGHASPAQGAKTREVSSPDPLTTQIQHGMIISCLCPPCHANSLFFLFFFKTNFLSLPFG